MNRILDPARIPAARGGPALQALEPLPRRAQSPAAGGAREALWLHLHLPHLALEVLLRGADAGSACVLAEGEGRRRRVALGNRHAVALGVRAGMPLVAAHALGRLQVLERNPRAEQRALERLCQWAMQLTPVVSPVAPDGLLLEVRGSLRLFGGIDGLLARLRRGLRQLGYRADYALAPVPLAASVLARARPREVVLDRHELQTALAALPLAALQLEAAQHEALGTLGVTTIGDCRRLPRDGLARRFSPAFPDMLDRLFGQVPDPRPTIAPLQSFDAEIDLPWEVTRSQALLTAGEKLLHELGGYLIANAAVTRCLRWRLVERDGEVGYFEIGMARATRDTTHMLGLLREALSRRSLRAPVQAIGLNVSDISFGAAPGVRDLFDRREEGDGEACAAFIDRLRSRCGEQALRTLGLRSAHRPEQAWCWRQPAVLPQRRVAGLAHVEGARARRPLWLLRRAVKLEVRDRAPLFDGPLELTPDRERIVNGWWDDAGVARDYYVATTVRGGRLWIYRELGGERHWYLHGIFE